MAQFSKNIISRNQEFEFWFTEIFESGLVRVFITVIDANGKLICFSMKRNENKHWKVVEARSLPIWIMALEKELSQCIEGNPATDYLENKWLKS